MARADLELTRLQGQALDMLRDGPRYVRSLQAKGLKAVGAQLVDLGLAERCGTPTNNYRNRLRLTPKGEAMLPPADDARGEQGAEEAAPATAGRSNRQAQVGGGRVQPLAPADGERLGQRMARDLVAAWEASGMPITVFFAPLTKAPQAFLSALRKSRTNKAATIDKIVAFLASAPMADADAPRAVRKRPPMPKRVPLGPDAGANIDERRTASLAAAEKRRGGETLADAVRRCGRELDAEEAAETVAAALPARRSFQPIAPERWGQLAALAARMGVTQSAALDLALGVGIAGLNEDLDEEEAG